MERPLTGGGATDMLLNHTLVACAADKAFVMVRTPIESNPSAVLSDVLDPGPGIFTPTSMETCHER